MSAPVAQHLAAARAKVASPGAWDPSWYAHDAAGKCVSANDPSATRFNVTGSILVTSGRSFDAEERALFAFRSANRAQYVVEWETERGRKHADVLVAFDRAIAFAEKMP